MNVWRLITHWEDPEGVLAWSKKEGRIGIGWGPGDVRRFSSPKEISEKVREVHVGLHNWPYSGQQLWDFSRTMKFGDLIIMATGGSSSRRVSVFIVNGDYLYVSNGSFGLNHQRPALPTTINPDQLWALARGLAPGYSRRWTLVRCQNPIDKTTLDRLME